MLINLLSNAIKFSKKRGDIYIQIIKHSALEEGFANIKIQVADQGIGMTEEHLEGIFKPFHKVNTAESKALNPNGNGLGLSICKKIAECLNGDLIVSSV